MPQDNDTSPMGDLDAINQALKAAGLKTKVACYLAEDGYGMYRQALYRTNRGGKLCVVAVSLLSTRKVHIKSVLRIVNKRRRYTLLINGQGGKNTRTQAFFAEGKGPSIADYQPPNHRHQE